MSILDRPVVVRMAVDSSYIEVLYPVGLISPVVCSKSTKQHLVRTMSYLICAKIAYRPLKCVPIRSIF